MNHKAGFTLIEVLVVIAIIGLLSSFLVSQFGRSRVDLSQAVNAVTADIRQAQVFAASGQRHAGVYRCGYGAHFVSATQYILYAGPDAQSVDCTADDRNYINGTDAIVRTVMLIDTRFDIGSPLPLDIFFEPPNPLTYINNESLPTTVPARIILHTLNADCSANPSQCRAVCVYRSGKIQIAPTWTACP